MKRSPLLVLEWASMLAVIASVIYTALKLFSTNHLGQPFVFDTNDTFMDWFNTAYWTNVRGAYEIWGSIYPPLSFAFLDLTTLPSCYRQSAVESRSCDWLAHSFIYGSYFLNVVLVSVAFWRNDRTTAIPRSVAFALGLPLLFTLERGNLILVTLPFFVIAYGQITKSERWKALSIAMTINFKPYLVLPALSLAFHRQWRPLELAGIATIMLYLATLAFVGGGTPQQLIENMTAWVAYQGGMVFNEINYSTSYAPFTMLRQVQISFLGFIPSKILEGIEFIVPIIIRSTQLLCLVTLVLTWLQPQTLTPVRIATLILGTYLISHSPGGYTQSFLLFLVFLERREGVGPTVAIFCTYVLMLVFDIHLTSLGELPQNSWIRGASVITNIGPSFGHFIRPGLIVILIWALALDSLGRIYRAHQEHRPNLGLAPQ